MSKSNKELMDELIAQVKEHGITPAQQRIMDRALAPKDTRTTPPRASYDTDTGEPNKR